MYEGPTLEDVRFIVRRCRHCNIQASQTNTRHVQPIRSKGPMDRLVIDLMDFTVCVSPSLNNISLY